MVNKLTSLPAGKRLKLNDLSIGDKFMLKDDHRRLIKGQKVYFRGKPTTRYEVHEIDIDGNLIKTFDLSLQRTVKPILTRLV